MGAAKRTEALRLNTYLRVRPMPILYHGAHNHNIIVHGYHGEPQNFGSPAHAA